MIEAAKLEAGIEAALAGDSNDAEHDALVDCLDYLRQRRAERAYEPVTENRKTAYASLNGAGRYANGPDVGQNLALIGIGRAILHLADVIENRRNDAAD